MAVILTETTILRGKEYKTPVYKSEQGVVTEEERQKTDEADNLLSQGVKGINAEMKKEGYLQLKGKPGVIRFWYELGKRIGALYNKLYEKKLISKADEKFLWRVVYEKAPELLSAEASSEPSDRIERFVWLAIRIGKLPYNDVKDIAWTAWVDLIPDQRVIRDDDRVLDWLITKLKSRSAGQQQDWTRDLVKLIHDKIGNRDTSVLSDAELKKELERIVLPA